MKKYLKSWGYQQTFFLELALLDKLSKVAPTDKIVHMLSTFMDTQSFICQRIPGNWEWSCFKNLPGNLFTGFRGKIGLK